MFTTLKLTEELHTKGSRSVVTESKALKHKHLLMMSL